MTHDPFLPPSLNDASLWNGLRVGLLGGSFNPPHEGHTHIGEVARAYLGLDAVWWLVSPQNPLKSPQDLLDYDTRYALCADITAPFPNLIVTDIERQIGTNRSYDTLRALKRRFRRTDFVWITGMDNALSFHKWYRWQDILALMPTAHIARPPFTDITAPCPLKNRRSQSHILVQTPARWPLTPRTSYWLQQDHMVDLSSTEIRELSDGCP